MYVNELRRKTQFEPIQGTHWKVEYGIHYFNTEENSYPMNEEFEGRKKLFEWYDKKATMTEEQIAEVDRLGKDDDEVFEAKKKAYEWNLDAKLVAPVWKKWKELENMTE